MAIHALGKETALLLRASALVVTPLSLIKELLDNAIDAKATSVKIQMARDGVGQIEVQDNGTGICPEDFDALGRRAHTSKLRAFQDLPRVGGMSLGFRGEALAAANSFAEVTITTRTSQEKVGHRVQLEPKRGGVKKHDLISTPVGTTVRVRNLFANIPVRKKLTIDNIQKSTVDVKHLLQAYVLARPQIRLSFAILGDNKSPWSYSPVGTPTVREAALQILGKDFAAHYTSVTLTESGASPNNKLVKELTEHEMSGITVDALLPEKDADIPALCKRGAFISVDGRPMSASRGTMKKVVAAFKARFDSVHCRVGAQSGCSNVFLQVNVRCPPGSYDINVSPAKDEILFLDESRVMNIIDRLLENTYPLTEKKGSLDGKNNADAESLSLEDLQLLESFSVSGKDSPRLGNSSHANSEFCLELVSRGTCESNNLTEVEKTVSSSKDNVKIDTSWAIDMSNPCDDDSVPQPTAASVIDQLRSAATQQANKHSQKADITEDPDKENHPEQTMISEPRPSFSRSPDSRACEASAPSPWTTAIENAKAHQQFRESDSFMTNSMYDLEAEGNPVASTGHETVEPRVMFPISPSPDIAPDGHTMCTPPRVPMPPGTGVFRTPPSSDERNLRQRNVLPRFRPPTMLGLQDRQPRATHRKARSQQDQQQVKLAGHEVFRPPYDEYQVENGLTLDSYMVPMYHAKNLPTTTETCLQGPVRNGHLPEAANPPAGIVARSSSFSPTPSMRPFDAPGDENHGTMGSPTTDELPNQHDPRKYLARRRRSMSRDRKEGRVLRRMKSAFLPLETPMVGKEMNSVALSISTDCADLRVAVSFLFHVDSYVRKGSLQPGLPDDLEGAAHLQTRLYGVCDKWMQRTTGRSCDLELNLRGKLKGKSCG